MTTQERIEEIIDKEFNNYGGSRVRPIKKLHDNLRKALGDKSFLIFLEKAVKENPRPIYKPSTKL